jgi:hypothetical protein
MLLNQMKKLYLEKYNVTNVQYQLLERYQKLQNRFKKDNACEIRHEEKITKAEQSEIKKVISKIPCIVLFSKHLLQNFKQRYHLTYRRINHISCKTTSDLNPSIAKFVSTIQDMREQNAYPLELIINFDETPVFFDSIPNYSYVERGIRRVEVKTASLQKKRVTLGLGISAAGHKLRPMMIFKGEGNSFKKLSNSQSILLRKNQSAWMTEALFRDWIRNELKFYLDRQRRLLKQPNAKALLLIDRFSGHISKEINDLGSELNMDISYIPAGTTCVLQPLDLRVNRKVKEILKNQWLDWYVTIDLTLSKLEIPTRQMIYDWFMASWNSLSPKEVITAFLESGLTNNLDGSEDILSKNLKILKEIAEKNQPEPMNLEGEVKNERMDIEDEGKMVLEDQFEEDFYQNQEIKEEPDE